MTFSNQISSTLFACVLLTLGACSEHNIQAIDGAENGNAPSIEVFPYQLDFGIVPTDGGAVSRSFSVTNVGASDLEIKNIQFEGEHAASFLLPDSDSSFLLPPGASNDIEVLLVTPESFNVSAQAYISSNDTYNEVLELPLVGAQSAPYLNVLPNPLDMGSTYVGCELENVVLLENGGTEDLHIEEIVHTGNEFELLEKPALPLTLSPGDFSSLRLSYAPENEGTSSGMLTILSNDPRNSGVYMAYQKGSSSIMGTHVQSWENPVDPPSDIVFSVDLSGSMSDDAARLAQNFEYFIQELSNYTNDWRIIVANADDGCNNSGILTPSTLNYEEIFSNSVQTGSGSNTERLLTVARNAIENTDSGECNEGFLRPEAMLHVVMVSDEREQSYEPWSGLIADIQSKKGNPGYVRLSAIAGMVPYSFCGTAEAGTGYWEVANATSGVFLDFCSDWSSPENLEVLAEASVLTDSYPLEKPAVAETIAVFVNGAMETEGWFYDRDLNSVVFDENPPLEGDDVVIRYGERAVCD